MTSLQTEVGVGNSGTIYRLCFIFLAKFYAFQLLGDHH